MSNVGRDDVIGCAPDIVCRICGGRNIGLVEAREMMFGTRDRFQYRECFSCGCVQIEQYPDNIEKYYPADYRSHSASDEGLFKLDMSRLKKISDYAKLRLVLSSRTIRRGVFGSDATRAWVSSRPIVQIYMNYVPNPASRILDVGCGTGVFMKYLHFLYYRNTHGVDPFIKEDVYFAGRLLVKKASLADLTPSYDCISFHHVLEHMPNQLAVLSETRKLLSRDGVVIIRIPVTNSFAWRKYQANWAQLDAPRHFYLHTERSFALLADKSGFDVISIDYDSTGFQFWASELYARNIGMYELGSPEGPGRSIFLPEQMAEYDKQAVELNKTREGDQIIAILRRKDTT